MKICRFDDRRVGVVHGDRVADVTSVIAKLPSLTWPFPADDQFIAHLDALRPAIEAALPDAPVKPLEAVQLLSPVANIGKVVAAPVNYEAHFTEAVETPEIRLSKSIRKISDAGLFLKATSSVVGAHGGVAVRFPDRRSDHEVELAVVIGRECRDCRAEDALAFVAGYTIGLDMTVRGIEDRSFRKSVDSYTVLGPWMVTADEILDPDALDLEIRVNGDVRQSSNTRRLIIGTRELIAWASRWYTLYPGDVLMTGTPEGVGPVQAGDVLTASIERIGTMTTYVRATDPSPISGSGVETASYS